MKVRWWNLALGLAALGYVFAPAAKAQPSYASDRVANCQKKIETEGAKLQASIRKALQLCKDTYRAEVAKVIKGTYGTTLDDLWASVPAAKQTAAAVKCEKALAKVLGAGPLNPSANASGAEKAYNKLDKLTIAPTSGPDCTDANLLALGHLPKAQYGDAWIRWTLVSMLKAAYEQQVNVVGDVPQILGDLGAVQDAVACAANPGTYCCPTCQKIQAPPCNRINCRLAASSSSTVNLGATPIVFGLNGQFLLDACQYSDWIGSDIAIVGNPGRGTNAVALGINDVCITGVRAQGFWKCGGPGSLFNGPKNTSVCQAQGPDAETCSVSGGLGTGQYCRPVATGATCSGGDPGDVCIDLNTPNAAAGDVVMLAHLLFETVTPGTPTGSNCTGGSGNLVPIPITTGTFESDIAENPGTGCSGGTGAPVQTQTGASLACPSGFLSSQSLNGLSLAGGFASAYNPGTGGLPDDISVKFNLDCGP